jgi:hypothetical protein
MSLYRWKVLPDLVTATNEPRQFFTREGELFVYGVFRESGPPDTQVPRRIIGTGGTRRAAYADAVENVRAYDPTYLVDSVR